jgi:hypothetical protein
VALSDDQKAMLRLLAQREQGYDDIASLTGGSVDDVRAKVRDSLAALDTGLSDDQKAILRLLAQREEGYGDIAALTGGDVEAVRAKVRSALAELGAEAKPAERAPEPPPPPPKAEPKPPPAPAPKAAATPPKPAAKAAPKAAPKLKLPEDQGARRALVAGGAAVVVIVLLLVTGVLGGSDGGSSDSTTASTTGGESAPEGGGTPTANGKEPTQAVLTAVDGSDAKGQALFGREGKAVVMLLGAKGLPQAPQGQSYTVSLVRSGEERLPLVATKASKSGVVSGRFQIAAQVLGLLAGGFDTMELSIVPDDELRTALKQARTAKKPPNYGGTTILEGPVTGPIVEAGEEG